MAKHLRQDVEKYLGRRIRAAAIRPFKYSLDSVQHNLTHFGHQLAAEIKRPRYQWFLQGKQVVRSDLIYPPRSGPNLVYFSLALALVLSQFLLPLIAFPISLLGSLRHLFPVPFIRDLPTLKS